jgi:hypothetical protein
METASHTSVSNFVTKQEVFYKTMIQAMCMYSEVAVTSSRILCYMFRGMDFHKLSFCFVKYSIDVT